MRKEGVEALAASQHGLLTRAQALSAGLTEGDVRARLGSGRWASVHRSVYRICGAPLTEVQMLLAAVLAAGAGATASHRAAAWLWGLQDELCVEVTVPPNRSPKLGAVAVHRPHLEPQAISCRRGVPVTNPLRTLLDLAAVPDDQRVEQALDRGLARRLFNLAAVEAELARHGGRGRRGTARLRLCLAQRGAGPERPPSMLESRMQRLLLAARLPAPRREHRVLGGRYRLDFAWPEAGLAVEVDGYSSHSSLVAFQEDRTRQNALVAAGWTVLRFTWKDLWEQPAAVTHRLEQALAASRPA